jgi:hypothetical protein
MTALTATALLTKAYRDAQKLPRGASLSADQLSDGLDILNDLINLWQTQGLKLFLELEQSVVLVASQQDYTFMPGGSVSMARPLEVKEAVYRDASSNSRILTKMSREEWTRLSNRTATGSVNQYFAELLYDRLTLHLWNVPDVTAALGTVKAVLRTQATNYTAGSDAVKFAPEWAIALRWGVADELTSGMPDSVVMRCQQRAQAYRDALEAWDVENAQTYFQMDYQGMAGSVFP